MTSLLSELSTISLGDTSEFSGDNLEPNDHTDPVLYNRQTRDQNAEKKGKRLEKKEITIKDKETQQRRKSHEQKEKHGHTKDQREDEKMRAAEERRRAYEEEELRIEKGLKKEEEENEEESEQPEGSEEEEKEEEDVLRGDVFRMPPRFPIPEPSTEVPALPTGCSILDNTISCVNAKLKQIPPIMDAELTSIELVGKEKTDLFIIIIFKCIPR